jgi:hypothetical protein
VSSKFLCLFVAAYQERIDRLISAMCAEACVRLPGSTREQKMQRVQARGLETPAAVLAAMRQLAQGAAS